MSCPFSFKLSESRQQSISTEFPVIDDDLSDVSDDSSLLTLSNLNSAIRLLTSPTNVDVNNAILSVIRKHGLEVPAVLNLQKMADGFVNYPNYDYLADLEDILLEMDELATRDTLVLIGQELIHLNFTGLMERAFRCLGTDLQELLESLNSVYDVLKDDTSDDTGFVCAAEGELIFTSQRPIVAWLLLGAMRVLTKLLFGFEAEIGMVPDERDFKKYHYRFGSLAAEDSVEVHEEAQAVPEMPNSTEINSMMLSRFAPWHFIINRDMEFVQVGSGFNKLFKKYFRTFGRSLVTYLQFKRPKELTVNFYEISRRTNTPFLLSLCSPPGCDSFYAKDLDIKGQMTFCPETDTILFIGSPFLDSLEGLTKNGLYISDIPLFDATREVILVGEQARAQDGLRRRMDKLKSSIEEANAAVIKERKKNVSLLHLIFPAEIAENLWDGSTVDAKTYANVTLLFSDIVGFTSVCSTASPFQVINMLESLYKVFDEFCGYFDVYKVETIGDAYCVAGGLHRQNEYDAHKVAWMALRMINVCSMHHTPDGKNIQMRIGLHTGTVLAGVVGKKMPRYCLFGHNVTIANKFESASEAGHINLSETTVDFLTKRQGFNFEVEEREGVRSPHPDQPKSFFLTNYRHPSAAEDATLHENIAAAMDEIAEKATCKIEEGVKAGLGGGQTEVYLEGYRYDIMTQMT